MLGYAPAGRSALATCADSQPHSRRLVAEISAVGSSSGIDPTSESNEHSPSSDMGCRPQQRSMIGTKQGMAPVNMPKKPNDRTAMRLGRAPRSLPLPPPLAGLLGPLPGPFSTMLTRGGICGDDAAGLRP